MSKEILKPKLFTTIKKYRLPDFYSDLSAGLIVGVVALPLAIAFAIASGLSPEKGLITAVTAGFIISFLGGSKVQIGGPTGAFVVIVYSIVQRHGINGLTVATIMAGIMLVGMGFFRLGSFIKFIPHQLIVGFTSGVALIIFSSQIKDFFGLQMGAPPADFVEKWGAYIKNFHAVSLPAMMMGLGSLLFLILWPKISKKIPASLIVLILATIVATVFKLPVDTIGTRFGDIANQIPIPTLPHIDFKTCKTLFPEAVSIALLAAIESLLSAVVSDGMIGGKHRANMELIAQGVANIFSPLFGGMPATGAIARTATNVKNGARSPIAGIIHAITLLLIMLFFGKYAKLIPLPALAAILIVISYQMSEWRSFKMLLKSPRGDVLVLLLTFGLTIIIDLTVAIKVGMIFSLFFFMHRMSMTANIKVLSQEFSDEEEEVDPMAIENRHVPKGVEVYEINGPFFFGAAEKFKEAMKYVEYSPKVRILRMRHVLSIDATGLHILKDVYKQSSENGCQLILSGVHAQPLFAITQSGFLDLIGEQNVHPQIDAALDRAKEILDKGP